MPDYDYNCKSCNHNFTINKSMTDDTIPVCPSCKSAETVKIWGGFQLKGCCKTSGTSAKNCGSCSGSSCSGCK